jgi:hypothetical protein
VNADAFSRHQTVSDTDANRHHPATQADGKLHIQSLKTIMAEDERVRGIRNVAGRYTKFRCR